MRKTIQIGALLAALLLPVLAEAQTQYAPRVQKAILASKWDLDATTTTFPMFVGQDGSPFGGTKPGGAPISTSGSSTTVTSTTASTNAFADVAVGDILYIQTAPLVAPTVRYVTARASADSITVDSAITLTAASFRFLTFTSGTGATSGWVNVASAWDVKFAWRISQQDTTGGIDVVVYCKDEDDTGVGTQVYPPNNTGGARECEDTGNFATTTTGCAVTIPEGWGACRIGFKIHTADDGADTNSHAEQVYASVRTR